MTETVSSMKSELATVNRTLTALNLQRFVTLVNGLVRDVSDASNQAQSAVQPVNVVRSSVNNDLIPRVAAVDQTVAQWDTYNASLWSGLQRWAANFDKRTPASLRLSVYCCCRAVGRDVACLWPHAHQHRL